jgi:hypothetical protein
MIYCQGFQSLQNLKKEIKYGLRSVGFDKLSRRAVLDFVNVPESVEGTAYLHRRHRINLVLL